MEQKENDDEDESFFFRINISIKELKTVQKSQIKKVDQKQIKQTNYGYDITQMNKVSQNVGLIITAGQLLMTGNI